MFSLAAYCSVLTEMGINSSYVHGSCFKKNLGGYEIITAIVY